MMSDIYLGNVGKTIWANKPQKSEVTFIRFDATIFLYQNIIPAN